MSKKGGKSKKYKAYLEAIKMQKKNLSKVYNLD